MIKKDAATAKRELRLIHGKREKTIQGASVEALKGEVDRGVCRKC
jgi:hypothetical protein